MNRCEVKGKVINMGDGRVDVNIIPPATCSSCGARSLCGSGMSRNISVKTSLKLQNNDELLISMRSGALLSITFALYMAGVIFAVILSLISSYYFHFSEVKSALVFVISVFIYLPVAAKLLSKKYSNKITYTIVKKD